MKRAATLLVHLPWSIYWKIVSFVPFSNLPSIALISHAFHESVRKQDIYLARLLVYISHKKEKMNFRPLEKERFVHYKEYLVHYFSILAALIPRHQVEEFRLRFATHMEEKKKHQRYNDCTSLVVHLFENPGFAFTEHSATVLDCILKHIKWNVDWSYKELMNRKKYKQFVSIPRLLEQKISILQQLLQKENLQTPWSKEIDVFLTQQAYCFAYASFRNKEKYRVVSVQQQFCRAYEQGLHWVETNQHFLTIAKAVLEQNEFELENFPIRWKSNKEIVSIAIEKNAECLFFASEELQQDEQIVTLALKQNPNIFRRLSDSMKKNITIVKVACAKDGTQLQFVDKSLLQEKEIVSIAVGQNGSAIYYASPSYLKNPQMVCLALQTFPDLLENAKLQKLFQEDITVMMQAVSKNGLLLKYASARLKKNKTLVRSAMLQTVDAIQYASKELLNDKVLIKEAVQLFGTMLRYASPRLQDDEEIVRLAYANTPYALQYASPRLKELFSK